LLLFSTSLFFDLHYTTVIFPQHVQGGRQETCVTLLVGFRNYLHYHIKATKTYMHMRMRKRVAGLLQVLNRAVPEVEDKAKKTAQGKTFTRG
jgi:actin related protein 2/3 complex, subunit 2